MSIWMALLVGLTLGAALMAITLGCAAALTSVHRVTGPPPLPITDDLAALKDQYEQIVAGGDDPLWNDVFGWIAEPKNVIFTSTCGVPYER